MHIKRPSDLTTFPYLKTESRSRKAYKLVFSLAAKAVATKQQLEVYLINTHFEVILQRTILSRGECDRCTTSKKHYMF